MDFLNLHISAMKRIYNVLGVPTPLIFDDAAKFANFSEAKLALYDNTVIPLTKLIYSELTDFLMPRYPGSEDLILSFNEGDIPALQSRHTENLERKQKLGIYTINELRALDGAGALSGDGVNQVYLPATMLPVGEDDSEKQSTKDYFTSTAGLLSKQDRAESISTSVLEQLKHKYLDD
jgi:phage portal protein BeeE